MVVLTMEAPAVFVRFLLLDDLYFRRMPAVCSGGNSHITRGTVEELADDGELADDDILFVVSSLTLPRGLYPVRCDEVFFAVSVFADWVFIPAQQHSISAIKSLFRQRSAFGVKDSTFQTSGVREVVGSNSGRQQ